MFRCSNYHATQSGSNSREEALESGSVCGGDESSVFAPAAQKGSGLHSCCLMPAPHRARHYWAEHSKAGPAGHLQPLWLGEQLPGHGSWANSWTGGETSQGKPRRQGAGPCTPDTPTFLPMEKLGLLSSICPQVHHPATCFRLYARQYFFDIIVFIFVTCVFLIVKKVEDWV